VLPSVRCSVSPPRRVKPPWKSIWKGPLPPTRLSPSATLGDFLPQGSKAPPCRRTASPIRFCCRF
jgi:hypothetical protein